MNKIFLSSSIFLRTSIFTFEDWDMVLPVIMRNMVISAIDGGASTGVVAGASADSLLNGSHFRVSHGKCPPKYN